jgi:hypothetical protein
MNGGRPAQTTWAAFLCGALCIVFALAAWDAVRRQSATTDEPSHAAIGWLMLWRGDFRFSPDVPPLWEDWIALGIGKNGLHMNAASPAYRRLLTRHQLSAWTNRMIYHTPGNDGVAIVNRARRMALVWGVTLAALIGWWAWELGGPVAAVAATFLYCLDPNFLGHAALAKNDVVSAFCYLAAAYAFWRAGQRLTWMSVAGVSLTVAVAVMVKFSGLLLGPALVLVLGARALSPRPWMILGRPVRQRWRKLAAVGTLAVATFLLTYGIMWACYDFRFKAGPDGMSLTMTPAVDRLRTVQLGVRLHPSAAQVAAWRMPWLTQIICAAQARHLIPQAWAAGFIYSQVEDQGQRPGYLLGVHYRGGRWYYFPLAALFKEPLTTLAVTLAAAETVLWATARGEFLKSEEDRWMAVALAIPAGVYALAALTAQINIGYRHFLPVLPFLFIAAALAVRRWWRAAAGKWIVLALSGTLIAETAGAFPHFIAYFNFAVASHRLGLLSDSNLDWGQDLPALAAWQRNHPKTVLYYDCFGQCDPAAYGIRCVNMPDGYPFGALNQLPAGPGVVALSTTNMQLHFFGHPEKWRQLGLSPRSKPEKILNHTIYLYAVPSANQPMLR